MIVLCPILLLDVNSKGTISGNGDRTVQNKYGVREIELAVQTKQGVSDPK